MKKERFDSIIRENLMAHGAEIDEVFAALQAEIEHIFASVPIQSFCEKHHIRLRAAAEYAAVMEPLGDANLTWLKP